jgi:hypothetical protein
MLQPAPAGAEDIEEPAPAANTSETDEQAYNVLAHQQIIAEIESRDGAYAGDLSESLLSLALNLQAQGRHEEAIAAFRRGIHLTRINEGLHCVQQIPLLQGELASHVARRDYAAIDERQNYLFRVQTQSLPSGDSLAEAMMQQAQWQYQAYQLHLEQEDYTRLINMSELYRAAAQDVIEREGDRSSKLLRPLRGMLQAQYLISRHDIEEPEPHFSQEDTRFGQIAPRVNESLLRFKGYRSQSYQQGNAIIEAIAGLAQEDASAMAQSRVMLGDWRLWNGNTEAAWEAYREAERELAATDDAQQGMQHMFGVPVALPDLPQLNPLPPAVDPNKADVAFAFGVSEYGRVQDLERIDDNEEQDRVARRLLKQLRKTTFRPRFEAGQPVETDNIVKAFNIQQ